MFGRTLKLAAVLVMTQLSDRLLLLLLVPPVLLPWPLRRMLRGPAPACGGCACGYTPTGGTAGPMVAPLPTISVAPTPVGPTMPPAMGSAGNPIVDRVPFSSANYTHPIR